MDLSRFLDALSCLDYRGMISTEVFNPQYAAKHTQAELIAWACRSLSAQVQRYDVLLSGRPGKA